MEYLNKYSLNAGDNIIPCPSAPIKGIYADNEVTVKWQYNQTVGLLQDSVKVWEPNPPFNPARTSYLVVTATVATNLSMRVELDG